jgi:hypothetical protein
MKEVHYLGQHLHDGIWWGSSPWKYRSQDEAITAAERTTPEDCNGNKVRVVKVTVETTQEVLFENELKGE